MLWRDYCSWEVEHEAHSNGLKTILLNAVPILQKIHNVNAVDAKSLLWAEIEKLEERYCIARDKYLRENACDPEVIRWFGILELTIAGNALWSTTTARYNKGTRIPSKECRATAVKSYEDEVILSTSSSARTSGLRLIILDCHATLYLRLFPPSPWQQRQPVTCSAQLVYSSGEFPYGNWQHH
jgi:hypothetical protein